MVRRILLVALFALITFAAEIAHAEIFAAGPVYGGNLAELTGGVVTCRVFNAGLVPVVINGTVIFTNVNSALALISNSCTIPIGPAQYCAFAAISPGNFAYSCRLNVTGLETNVRGVAEVRGTSGRILNAMPLQK